MEKNKAWLLVSLLFTLAAIQTSALAQAPAATSGVEASAPHALSSPDVETWLDGYFPYALYSGEIAGAVVVVVKDGQVLFEKGYGYGLWREQARRSEEHALPLGLCLQALHMDCGDAAG
jgi:CubicO group peptidase (beta-lactamase class C family)